MHKTNSLKDRSANSKIKNINLLQSKLFTSIHTIQGQPQHHPSRISNSRVMPITPVINNFNRDSIKSKISGNKFPTFLPMGDREKKKFQKDCQDQDFVLTANLQDPLAKLITKAKELTSQNQGKILAAKKQLQRERQKYGTFLTGTGLFEQHEEIVAPLLGDHPDIDPNELLKQLTRKQQNDDLAELRRMIKITNKNLTSYQKQIYYSSQGVMNAADHFNKQIDSNLLYKVHKVKAPQGSPGIERKKKASSMNRIKDPKYY